MEYIHTKGDAIKCFIKTLINLIVKWNLWKNIYKMFFLNISKNVKISLFWRFFIRKKLVSSKIFTRLYFYYFEHMWLVGCSNPSKIEQSWECTFLKLSTHVNTKWASKIIFTIGLQNYQLSSTANPALMGQIGHAG